MKITEQEQIQRKERIIKTAFALFCEKGIEKVSMADIAKQAKVGEATIYRYFKNKPQLVLGTLSVLWEEIGMKIETTIEQTQNYNKMTGYQQFEVHLDCWRQLYLENEGYILFSYECKLYLLRNSVIITKEKYNFLMDKIKITSIAALEKGKKDRTIPVTQDSEDLFYAIWGMVRGYIVKIVIYKFLCEDGGPWESRYSMVEKGILSGLSSGWNF